jgi:hypothetical protein
VRFESHARDEGLVAADDHHDEQIGDHDDVDQAEDHQHQHRLVGLGRPLPAFHRDRVEHVLERGAFAESRHQQVIELLPEEPDVDRLCDDQAEVQRQLEPAAREDESRERAQGACLGHARRFLGHPCFA